MGMQTDQRLVAEVLQGQSERFAELVERYLPAVRAIAFSGCRYPRDVDDIVQETFVRAYEKLASLRKPDRFGSWLYAIARRCCINARERAQREAPLRDADASSVAADTPDVSRAETLELVRRHLGELPDQPREILLLYYYAGRSCPQIAQFLGISEAAVRKRLQRAREQLGASLVETLADTQGADRDIGKQAARIAAIATASSLYTAGSGGASAVAGVVGTVKGTLAVGVAAAVTAGAVFTALSVSPKRGESVTEPRDSDAGVTPIVTAQALAPLSNRGEDVEDAPATVEKPESNDPRAEPSEEAKHSEDSAPENTPMAESEREADDLTGAWRLLDSGRLIAEFDARQTGYRIVFAGRGDYIDVTGSGELWADHLKVEFVTGSGPMGRNMVRAEGSVTFPVYSIDLAGNVHDGEHPYTYENGEEVRTIQPKVDAFVGKLERIRPEELSRQEFVAKAMGALRTLASALTEYAMQHDHTYPPSLDELVSEHLADLSPYEEASGAHTRYLAAGRRIPDIKARMDEDPYPYPEPWDRDVSHEAFPIGERMILYEEYLERIWGAAFLDLRPLVIVKYDRFDLEYAILPGPSVVETRHLNLGGEGPVETWPDDRKAEMRARCTNNLKQLGLSWKMFVNESPLEYGPGGFITMWPEYIPDRRILSCPSKPLGASSYTLIVPGAGEPHAPLLYESVFGREIGTQHAGGVVPIVYETDACTASGKQHVLFHDGHVELLGPDEFAARVEPFLGLVVH